MLFRRLDVRIQKKKQNYAMTFAEKEKTKAKCCLGL